MLAGRIQPQTKQPVQQPGQPGSWATHRLPACPPGAVQQCQRGGLSCFSSLGCCPIIDSPLLALWAREVPQLMDLHFYLEQSTW